MADLDLTAEPSTTASVGTAPALATVAYDPSRDRERLRGKLAGWLLALLAAVAIGPVVALVFDQINSSTLKDILGGVFTPLLGVFGTVTGFYFGSTHPSQPLLVNPGGPASGGASLNVDDGGAS